MQCEMRQMPSWFVYILVNKTKGFIYIGSTNHLNRRLSEHNAGLVQSTKAFRPLELATYIALDSEKKARGLEKYFKTGSGKAILKKRILTDDVLQEGSWPHPGIRSSAGA